VSEEVRRLRSFAGSIPDLRPDYALTERTEIKAGGRSFLITSCLDIL